jgi:tetratricopeptide (TPR) repeat protein
MTILKFIPAFLLIAVYACGQHTPKRKVDPSVTLLCNKIIPLVNHLSNPDSCKQALLYLDSAVTIDNHCFQCHHNKLMFLCALKQFGEAVETINACISLKPSAHDLYLTGGILYEKVGDTIAAKKYFHRSLAILNSVLDTMDIRHLDHEMLVSNKAINLIMLGDNKTGNDLLKSILNSQKEPEWRELTLPFINKRKKELVEMMTTSEYRR